MNINRGLKHCDNCKPLDFFANKKFGSFDIISDKHFPLAFSIEKPSFFNIFSLNLIVCSFMIILSIWGWKKTRAILENYINQPLKKITAKLKSGETLTSTNEIEELSYLIHQIEDRENKLKLAKANEKMASIGMIASQVAHDIRSPLAALNAIIKQTSHIPEQQRIMIRTASQQINDIANNLLSQYTAKNIASAEIKSTKPELISLLLSSIISEKRAQYAQIPCEISSDFELSSHCSFVNLNAADFRRVISNLINNAVEASHHKGKIIIKLFRHDPALLIEISDAGDGMTPQMIETIMHGKSISTKSQGAGIGLNSAIKFVESWDGTLNLHSELNKGTTVAIHLPLLSSPLWFADELSFQSGATVIILDDDQSIHDVWQSRFQTEIPFINLQLIHLYHPDNLLSLDVTKFSAVIYLIDYELINQSISGLDVIESLNISQHAILVTSRYDDELIQKRCEHLKMKILPKDYAAYIPINIDEATTIKQPEIILIDDNKALTDAWKISASLKKKHIVIFNKIGQAREILHLYAKNIPIYIDSDLGEDICGEQYAKDLYHQGHSNIYLMTGDYSKNDIANMPWLKGTVAKDPNF